MLPSWSRTVANVKTRRRSTTCVYSRYIDWKILAKKRSITPYFVFVRRINSQIHQPVRKRVVSVSYWLNLNQNTKSPACSRHVAMNSMLTYHASGMPPPVSAYKLQINHATMLSSINKTRPFSVCSTFVTVNLTLGNDFHQLWVWIIY